LRAAEIDPLVACRIRPSFGRRPKICGAKTGPFEHFKPTLSSAPVLNIGMSIFISGYKRAREESGGTTAKRPRIECSSSALVPEAGRLFRSCLSAFVDQAEGSGSFALPLQHHAPDKGGWNTVVLERSQRDDSSDSFSILFSSAGADGSGGMAIGFVDNKSFDPAHHCLGASYESAAPTYVCLSRAKGTLISCVGSSYQKKPRFSTTSFDAGDTITASYTYHGSSSVLKVEFEINGKSQGIESFPLSPEAFSTLQLVPAVALCGKGVSVQLLPSMRASSPKDDLLDDAWITETLRLQKQLEDAEGAAALAARNQLEQLVNESIQANLIQALPKEQQQQYLQMLGLYGGNKRLSQMNKTDDSGGASSGGGVGAAGAIFDRTALCHHYYVLSCKLMGIAPVNPEGEELFPTTSTTTATTDGGGGSDAANASSSSSSAPAAASGDSAAAATATSAASEGGADAAAAAAAAADAGGGASASSTTTTAAAAPPPPPPRRRAAAANAITVIPTTTNKRFLEALTRPSVNDLLSSILTGSQRSRKHRPTMLGIIDSLENEDADKLIGFADRNAKAKKRKMAAAAMADQDEDDEEYEQQQPQQAAASSSAAGNTSNAESSSSWLFPEDEQQQVQTAATAPTRRGRSAGPSALGAAATAAASSSRATSSTSKGGGRARSSKGAKASAMEYYDVPAAEEAQAPPPPPPPAPVDSVLASFGWSMPPAATAEAQPIEGGGGAVSPATAAASSASQRVKLVAGAASSSKQKKGAAAKSSAPPLLLPAAPVEAAAAGPAVLPAAPQSQSQPGGPAAAAAAPAGPAPAADPAATAAALANVDWVKEVDEAGVRLLSTLDTIKTGYGENLSEIASLRALFDAILKLSSMPGQLDATKCQTSKEVALAKLTALGTDLITRGPLPTTPAAQLEPAKKVDLAMRLIKQLGLYVAYLYHSVEMKVMQLQQRAAAQQQPGGGGAGGMR
jgi:hypothetical protein